MKSDRRRFGFVVLALLIGHCDRDGSVGVEQCVGERIRCELPGEIATADSESDELSTTDLPELTPTWVRELPVRSDVSQLQPILTNAVDGTVWLFASQEEGIAVSTLDETGAVLDSDMVAPPAAYEISNAGGTPLSVRRSAAGLALRALWPVLPSPQPEEWIMFGDSPSDVRHRFEVDGDVLDRWQRTDLGHRRQCLRGHRVSEHREVRSEAETRLASIRASRSKRKHGVLDHAAEQRAKPRDRH